MTAATQMLHDLLAKISMDDVLVVGLAVLVCAGAALMLRRRPRIRLEHRRQPRFRVNTGVELAYRDGKGERRIKGRAVDISAHGACLRTGAAVAPHTMVFLCSTKGQLTGTAYVRRCERAGMGYHVGVEFRGLMMDRLRASA